MKVNQTVCINCKCYYDKHYHDDFHCMKCFLEIERFLTKNYRRNPEHGASKSKRLPDLSPCLEDKIMTFFCENRGKLWKMLRDSHIHINNKFGTNLTRSEAMALCGSERVRKFKIRSNGYSSS